MFRIAALLGLLGLCAATGMIVWSGWVQVVQALAQAGWGIVLVALFHLIPLTISAASWQALMPGRKRPPLSLFVYLMWVRAAVNNLMPVARIGGEIAVVRLMIARGMRKDIAVASTIVELTMSVVAVFSFVVVGVILFALRVNDRNIVAQLIWGLVFSLPVIAAFIAIQKIGFFRLLARLMRLMLRDKWVQMVGNGIRFDRAIAGLYRRRDRIAACGIMQVIAWSLGSVEMALALYFLGHPLPFTEAVMLEALIQGSASAAFAVPGALGVQEAGFLVFGAMLGLPHEIAAALAVMRRCRDLICYAPGLLVWQIHEGKNLLRDK